jgi:hypothetical protein
MLCRFFAVLAPIFIDFARNSPQSLWSSHFKNLKRFATASENIHYCRLKRFRALPFLRRPRADFYRFRS